MAMFLPKPRRSIIAFALLFALLVAQTGALLHAYTHLRGAPVESGTGTAPAQACDGCLSFAPLLAAASGPPGLVAPRCNGADEAPCSASIFSAELDLHHPYQSRAPPG